MLACQPENNHSRQRLPDKNASDTIEPPHNYLANEDFDLLIKKYDDPSRRTWQNPELVIRKLGDLTGKTVADIGAGTGYFTFIMAPLVERIIAIDIDKRALQHINHRKLELDNETADKILTRLSLESDPLLKEEEADIVLIINTYHFISDRVAYLQKVKKGLKRMGTLVLVDFKLGNVPVGPPETYRISPEAAIKELLDAGFANLNLDSKSLEFQYIITAKK